MIDYKTMDISLRDTYEATREVRATKGCEYSFSNLYMWGDRKLAFMHGCVLIYTDWDGFKLYNYPSGKGNRKAALDAIIADAYEKGIRLRIGGMDRADMEEMESFYPGRFMFRSNRENFDYVYDINALADLPGRKLGKKRNHIRRFEESHPGWRVETITANDLATARAFAEKWFDSREDTGDDDFGMERAAMDRAFRNYDALDMEGLFLYAGDELLAFTVGSRMTPDTFDTHFEKAIDIQGAYPMINREFARVLRAKYPELKYIDREEDMGLPGLRKAKLSYEPDHLIEKYVACVASEGFGDEV